VTQHEGQAASAVSTDPRVFQEKFDELAAELAPLFARREPQAHAADYLRGLLADLVGAENCIHEVQAACAYSWRMPPSRSRR
jgi:hypothetical protein